MVKKIPAEIEVYRKHPSTILRVYGRSRTGMAEGYFEIPFGKKRLRVLIGSGDGWDHVSVSLKHRVPTWDEMCFIRDIFFEPEELVVQYHPPESEYVNFCRTVLHLWRPWDDHIRLPPKEMLI